ncbi:uncharacterized protein ACBT44_010450 isoform 1-T1 [Syngnathus typhle]
MSNVGNGSQRGQAPGATSGITGQTDREKQCINPFEKGLHQSFLGCHWNPLLHDNITARATARDSSGSHPGPIIIKNSHSLRTPVRHVAAERQHGFLTEGVSAI